MPLILVICQLNYIVCVCVFVCFRTYDSRTHRMQLNGICSGYDIAVAIVDVIVFVGNNAWNCSFLVRRMLLLLETNVFDVESCDSGRAALLGLCVFAYCHISSCIAMRKNLICLWQQMAHTILRLYINAHAHNSTNIHGTQFSSNRSTKTTENRISVRFIISAYRAQLLCGQRPGILRRRKSWSKDHIDKEKKKVKWTSCTHAANGLFGGRTDMWPVENAPFGCATFTEPMKPKCMMPGACTLKHWGDHVVRTLVFWLNWAKLISFHLKCIRYDIRHNAPRAHTHTTTATATLQRHNQCRAKQNWGLQYAFKSKVRVQLLDMQFATAKYTRRSIDSIVKADLLLTHFARSASAAYIMA